MGVIYRARQRLSQRIVALKRVLSVRATSHGWLDRFLRETEATASLDHPNILPIYEVGRSEDGLPFFSMKFAALGSLRDASDSLRGKTNECVALMLKVARAVDYAHSKGILHRDLKPGNILLDARGEPMVSDFGLAKWLDQHSDLTETLTTFGTPGYIAPEQAEGRAADLTPAADIYSLGAILFELLSGRAPFIGDNALTVIRQAAETPAPRLRSLVRGADRGLETICARCLEREVSARYRSAGELARDLERWLEGKPITPRRVLEPKRIWRWSRRNPALIATAAVCLLLGAAAISFLRFPVASTPVRLISDKSIAVLPFENLNRDQQNAFFADGMQDDVLTALAKIADLTVISPSSVRGYKPGVTRDLAEIARTLHVRNIVEGSVRRATSNVRVSARLIDATTGAQLWAEAYDRELTEVFAIQSELAQAIAKQLQAKLSPAEKAAIEQPPTADLKAYDLYTEAKQLLTVWIGSKNAKETITKALTLLDEATQRDPNFVLAYCQAANAHANIYFNFIDKTPQRLALAKQAADNALRLAPDLGESHLAIARYYYLCLRDFDSAARELNSALRTLPNDADTVLLAAFIDRRQGRWDDCIAKLQKVTTLDPKNIEGIRAFIDTNIALRRYSVAEEFVKRQMTRVPESASLGYMKLAECSLNGGDLDAAKTWLAKMPADYDPNGFGTSYRLMAAIYLRDFEQAKRLVAEPLRALPDSVSGTSVPVSYFRSEIALAENDEVGAKAGFGATRADLLASWGDEPADPLQLGVLARIEAALGNKDEAIRRAKRAVELRPIAKDSLAGAWLTRSLAIVYACTGEQDLAIQQLQEVAKVPGGPTYGDLKFSPWWNALRSDPRFDAIVASLDPAKTQQ